MLCRTRVTSGVSYNRIDLDSTFDFLLFLLCLTFWVLDLHPLRFKASKQLKKRFDNAKSLTIPFNTLRNLYLTLNPQNNEAFLL